MRAWEESRSDKNVKGSEFEIKAKKKKKTKIPVPSIQPLYDISSDVLFRVSRSKFPTTERNTRWFLRLVGHHGTFPSRGSHREYWSFNVRSKRSWSFWHLQK